MMDRGKLITQITALIAAKIALPYGVISHQGLKDTLAQLKADGERIAEQDIELGKAMDLLVKAGGASNEMMARIAELELKNKVTLKILKGHKSEIDRLTKQNKILDDALDDYESIGTRVAAQDGNWLMLHAGAFDWFHNEFERLKQARQAAKEVDGERS